MSKPKLLLLSGIAVFPQTSGGATRLFHTIHELGKRHELHLWYWNPEAHQLTATEKEFLADHCQSFRVIECRPKSLLSFLDGIPYHFSNYYLPNLKTELNVYCDKHAIQNIRIEAAQLLYLTDFLPNNSFVEYVAHDIVTHSFWGRAIEMRNLLKRGMRLLHYWQTAWYEKRHITKPKAIIAVSKVDAKSLQKLMTNSQQLRVEPNGIAEICPLPLSKQLSIGFIGSPTHTPNQAAIKYIYTKLAPKLLERNPSITILLCGRGILGFVAQHQTQPNVQVIEGVDVLAEFYSQMSVLVVPLFAGSGTRLKILEALAFGRPVVTTEIGAEGIEVHSSYLRIIPRAKQDNLEEWLLQIETAQTVASHSVQEQQKLVEQLKPYLWSSIFAQS